jgi:hypothetical protein
METIFKTLMNSTKSEVDIQQALIEKLPCLVSTTIKTAKTEKAFPNWINALTYLLPNKILCPFSEQCFEGCLKGSGRLRMNKKAMIKRTKLYFQDFPLFLHLLLKELVKVHNKAKRKGKYFAYRPNGTSDDDKIVKALLALPFTERPFDALYDYTKVFDRVIEYKDSTDYHLTFSYDGTNGLNATYLLNNNISNVSVVFDVKRGEPLPKYFSFGGQYYPVKDGDLDDMRIFDKPVHGKGIIIGLRAKGSATKQDTAFVQPMEERKELTTQEIDRHEKVLKLINDLPQGYKNTFEKNNTENYMQVLRNNNS